MPNDTSYRSIKLPSGEASVVVGNTEAVFAAGPDAAIYASKGLGVSVNGTSLVLNSSPLSTQFSSMAVLNPLALIGIPSTIATPIPTFIFNIPGTGAIAQMAIAAATMAAVYGIVTAVS